MGIKHLTEITKMMSDHPDKEFSRTYLRDILNINYNSVLDSLFFLIMMKKVKQIDYEDGVRFKWNK